MRASTCVVCHEKEAAHRCVQCHKPVCDDCAFKDDQGVFCSRECSAARRSYDQANQRASRAKGSRSVVVAVAVIALVIALLCLAYVKGWVQLPGGAAPATNAPAANAPAVEAPAAAE